MWRLAWRQHITAIARAYKSRTITLLTILALRSVASGILGLALPLYVAASGHSASEWGLAAGAYAFAMTIGEPTWGWASDRLGIATPMLVGGLGTVALVPAYALSTSLGLLLGLQFLRGAVEIASSPAARKALAHSLGPGHKAVGVALFQVSFTAGSAFGPLLAGYLLAHGGSTVAFLACGVASLASVAATFASRATLDGPNPHEAAAAPAPAAGAPESGTGPFPAGFLLLCAVAASCFAASSGGRSFVPLLGARVMGLDAARVATVLSIAGVASGVATIGMGRLADVWGRRPVIAGGLVALGVALVGYGLVRSFPGLVACALLAAAGSAAAVPAGVALVSDITPLRRQGRMIGLYGAAEDIGIMLGPMLCGFLWDASGPRTAFHTLAFLPLLGLFCLAAVRERRE